MPHHPCDENSEHEQPQQVWTSIQAEAQSTHGIAGKHKSAKHHSGIVERYVNVETTKFIGNRRVLATRDRTEI
jgi:hypothetical protein